MEEEKLEVGEAILPQYSIAIVVMSIAPSVGADVQGYVRDSTYAAIHGSLDISIKEYPWR